jgi:hypothetical protein
MDQSHDFAHFLGDEHDEDEEGQGKLEMIFFAGDSFLRRFKRMELPRNLCPLPVCNPWHPLPCPCGAKLEVSDDRC